MDAWLSAGTAGDRTSWDARVSTADPSFATRSAMLFANLGALRPDRLHARLTGAVLPLRAARQAALGPDARVLQADLAWRVGGEETDASAMVWLTLVDGPDAARLVSTGDGPTTETPAEPLWWIAPTTRADRGRATVLVGAGQDATRWAALADRAATDVHDLLPAPLGRGWDGRVVVEVPGSRSDVVRVLGGGPAAYAGTAAVTRPEGPTTDAAVRVVVDPAAATGDGLATLLTHETVHVATRSAGSPAPLWVVEGLAELVALEAHPDQRATEVSVLRAAADDDQDPLPAEEAFAAGGPGVPAAYARAWLACRAVVERRGADGLGRLYAALDGGEALDRAATSSLGVDAATLTGWAQDAQRRALATGRG